MPYENNKGLLKMLPAWGKNSQRLSHFLLIMSCFCTQPLSVVEISILALKQMGFLQVIEDFYSVI